MLWIAFLLFLLNVQRAFARDEPDPDPSPPPSPVCDASTFSHPKLGSGVEVLSIAATPQVNYSTPKGHHGLPSISDLSFCRVKVHLAHAGSNDKTLVEIWLPLTHNDWNGRFQATGGGGFATGMFDSMLGPALKHGYAASSTDGGHDAGKYYDDLSWALNPDRTVNWGLLHIFATRSLAEMVIVGKSITEQFYGEKPRYSYWNGCSQGGRQGYAMAQKYPHLLDGILANAPAINLVHVAMGDYWPQIAMKEANTLMSTCELDLFRQKAMEECDMLDGVSDGIISDPDVCDFDPLHVIGKSFYCDGKEAEVTAEMADIVRKIESGPRTPFKAPIWHGLAPGTRTHYLASITISPDGIRSPLPFPISSNFMKTLLLKDPSFNVSELTYPSYMALWAQASYEYGRLLDADDTDLSALRTSGTKLLTWHGINDPVIPYQNTVRYRERVEREMGGARGVDKFYRLFLAPGVEHCAGGAGPVPEDALAALVDWVEKDEPPETLSATSTNSDGDLVTRELCAWPGKLRYMGIGDPKRWSSWTCEGGTERPEAGYVMEADEDILSLGISGRGSQHRFIENRQEEKEKEKTTGRVGQILGGLKDRLAGLDMGFRIG